MADEIPVDTRSKEEKELEVLEKKRAAANEKWQKSKEVRAGKKKIKELEIKYNRYDERIDNLQSSASTVTTDGKHPYFSRDSNSWRGFSTNISDETFEAMRKAGVPKSKLNQKEILQITGKLYDNDEKISRAKLEKR
jgi:hypothetical protein